MDKLIEDYLFYKRYKDDPTMLHADDCMNDALIQIMKNVAGIQGLMEAKHLEWIKDPVTITEICCDVLLKCLDNYIPATYGKFFTYYVTACNKEMLNTQLRISRVSVEDCAFEEWTNDGDLVNEEWLIPCPNAEVEFNSVEEEIELEAIKARLSYVLTDAEYDVCCLILDTPYKLKRKDVVELLGIRYGKVTEIFRSLCLKLSPEFFGII